MKKEKEEFQVVTLRVPKTLYSEYREVLERDGRIMTYDIRKHMRGVVEENKKNNREGHK